MTKSVKLRCPFTWKDRHVALHDRVWYIPQYYNQFETFKFEGWEHPNLFGNKKPVKIEYCSGNGAWIGSKAISDPHTNWVAVEMKFERARKIWSKIKREQLNNLLVVCGEAETLTEQYIPDDSVSEVSINFPDPWPKQRHAKNRIIKLPFIKELHRVLKPGGMFHFVTDDAPYSEIMIELSKKFDGFESVHPAPYYVHENSEYGTSFFEELWRERGRVIRYHQYRKI
ncbi:MAG: tRNA (guanosine(46)-N7)-methyltransferase TrmB [Parachlamydiaceae bacterium]|nr:tRNA (guanosine(46)-N7)-methyltransferase TrmB [Parachlamydiaceae bacterium]